MLLALLFIPTFAGITAFFIRSDALRRILLLLTAIAHAGVTVGAWIFPFAPVWGGWALLDAPGLLFLSITSVLFLAVAIYSVGYLRRESSTTHPDFEEGFLF